MKKKKPELKLTPLEKMVQFHKPSCTIHLYSMGNERKCSCGRDEAIVQYKILLRLAFLGVRATNG